MTVPEIISLFGGTSSLALAIDVPVSTVDSWRANNYIPRWRQSLILDLALRENRPLSATDFPERPKAAA